MALINLNGTDLRNAIQSLQTESSQSERVLTTISNGIVEKNTIYKLGELSSNLVLNSTDHSFDTSVIEFTVNSSNFSVTFPDDAKILGIPSFKNGNSYILIIQYDMVTITEINN